MGLNTNEWVHNLSHGEFSTGINGVSVTFGHGGLEYPVSVLEAQAWKRREVDKQLLTDIPAQTRSILIPSLCIPASISVQDYQSITVSIGDERFGVLFTTGTDPVRFFLIGIGENEVAGSEEDMLE